MLLGAGLSRFYHKMIGAPWLKLEEIEITGIKKLDRLDILNAMGLKRGQCTLSISTEQVCRASEEAPGGEGRFR